MLKGKSEKTKISRPKNEQLIILDSKNCEKWHISKQWLVLIQPKTGQILLICRQKLAEMMPKVPLDCPGVEGALFFRLSSLFFPFSFCFLFTSVYFFFWFNVVFFFLPCFEAFSLSTRSHVRLINSTTAVSKTLQITYARCPICMYCKLVSDPHCQPSDSSGRQNMRVNFDLAASRPRSQKSKKSLGERPRLIDTPRQA